MYFAMKFSQPFTSFGTWDGYSVYPGARGAYSSSRVQRGIRGVSARVGARGADRDVLREC